MLHIMIFTEKKAYNYHHRLKKKKKKNLDRTLDIWANRMNDTDHFTKLYHYQIIWKVIQLLDPVDLSSTRQSCKRLRTYCDHPSNWVTITLIPSSSSCELSLWSSPIVQLILQPHLPLIETIQIWGVRDNIIRYLLTSYRDLENLAIRNWKTLSDHAFSKQLTICTLKLNGQQHFTSLDAAAFAKIISNCPRLEEISITNCKIHIQAETFLDGMILGGKSLKSLVVATKRTWSSHHVTRLFQVCSSLKYLALLSGSSNTADLGLDSRMDHAPSVLEKKKRTEYLRTGDYRV